MSALRFAIVCLCTALAHAALAAPAAVKLFAPAAVAKAGTPPAFLKEPVPVTLEARTIDAMPLGAVLEADLPDGSRLDLSLEYKETHANGDLSWRARVVGIGRTDLIAAGTIGATGAHGMIQGPDREWGIAPGVGHAWLFDRDATERAAPRPPEKDWITIPPEATGRSFSKAACPLVTTKPTSQATIDVLFILGPDFIATHGGDAAAVSRVNALVNEANAIYSASMVAITFRVIATMRLPWGPATARDDGALVGAMFNQLPPFGSLKGVRNFFGADFVVYLRGPFIADGSGTSGVAPILGNGNADFTTRDSDQLAYNVVGDKVGNPAGILAHELGHLLGDKHDRFVHGTDPTTGSTPYSFGHYVCTNASCASADILDAGTGFGTIMSYWNPGVRKFSSPNLTCIGNKPASVAAPCGANDLQDNVRAMNCVRDAVAAFRKEWQFSCADPKLDSDRDGIPDCLEANSGRANGTKDNDVFADALLFAAQQYRDFLAREADADGLNFWTETVKAGTFSRGQAIESFFNSPEFQGTISPVARLYFAYFLRVPDYAGLNFWIGYYKAGNPLAAVSQNFATSAEFTARYGSLNNGQFVDLVYQNVLGRAADAPGRAFWKGQLDSGAQTRGQVMLGFSESDEFKAAIASEVYVTMMYMGMLRRGPDNAGFGFWVQYKDAGNPGLALIDGFLASTEYKARFLP